ncbi:hypothetical protein QOZ80_5AG0385400 [Eleusine coracana subsp. coracana]|nr:hypothetical protein QOZ80_5AG0385400 [Eleusine coracana subsp. coracana]
MPYFHIIIVILFTLNFSADAVTMDTISASQVLTTRDKLVSENGRYALGFFEVRSTSFQNISSWYLGIWFNSVPKFTQAWVANRDNPINNSSTEMKINHDGNLIVSNKSNGSVIWSTQVNITRNNTVAILLNTGNLILRNDSNSSDIFWQSFDHPTDSLFPGAKLGWDKATGMNRRLVSRKNSISPATGAYIKELDPSGVNQILLTPLNSSMPYWSSGVWNGQYFAGVPEMATHSVNNFTFVDYYQQKYFTYGLLNETTVMHHLLDVSGQIKSFIWVEDSQDWAMVYSKPKAQCDVYAICGPFTLCNDDIIPHCTCMKGFSIKSSEDWELDDRTSGCIRNSALDCTANANGSITSSTDMFYPILCVSLSQSSNSNQSAKSQGECSQVCLDNCSCTAYTFSNSICSIWHEELLNIRQLQCSSSTNLNGKTLYLRLSAKDVKNIAKSRTWLVIGLILGLFAFIMLIMLWENKRKRYGISMSSTQGSNGIIAFRYFNLQQATKSFSVKVGGGGFGSVFKGSLNDSTAIAVKRLDLANQGEKQFRAEVSSIGIIQHINLVKLIGFCCEGARRLLVYEYMPNGSLDVHLFQSQTAVLKWSTRYQIALGVARGLAYLHENCHDCIIHCDIKPENILLGDTFIPKIADFGMAKFVGRDFSRVVTTMRGTIGYLAPEWISGVAITPKVDVYSYGMVLLEIISGRRNSCIPCSCASNHNVYWPVYVARKILNGGVRSLLDHRFNNDVNLNEAEIVCKVACWCIQDNESDRPTMGEVVQILEGLLEIEVPPMPRLLEAIAGSSHSTCS